MRKNVKKKRKLPIIIVIIFALILVFFLYFAPDLVDQGYGILYPLNYHTTVETYCAEYGLDSYLVMALIRTESNFDPDAVSTAGAIGLAQIMPDTGQWLSEKMGMEPYSEDMLYIPDTSIQMCCYYLNLLIERYGNLDTALAAYNAGMGTVSDWLKDPNCSDDGLTLYYIPYQETRNYVQRINDSYGIYRNLYAADNNQGASQA